MNSVNTLLKSYIDLTKPTIVLLFTLTGLAAVVIEGSLLQSPLRLTVILLGILLTAGSANALNMYFDRDIDEVMVRTRRKRPLPLKKLSPAHALWFGLVLGAVATFLLLIFGSPLAAFFGFGTIFFYVGIYTLILERRTSYNIVIGGAAGATAPLIGWAAATGQVSTLAWLMFLVIFMWTPPHFWALALVIKDDYKNTNVPMLPVVAGDRRTRLEILIYVCLLIPLTLWPAFIRIGGIPYLIGGSILGTLLLARTIKLLREKSEKSAYSLFLFSIVYLLLLFVILMGGAIVTR
jgi:heme o synthase